MRVVLDTGLLARAHPNATGLARLLLELVLVREDTLILTHSILCELARAMRYPRLRRQSKLSELEIDAHIAWLEARAQIVQIFDAPIPPIRDPNDIHIVQAAICASAEYLCTLDKHFFEEPTVAFCADRGVTVISDIDLLKKLRQ